MHLKEIPHAIFQELCTAVGEGDERRVRTDGYLFRVRDLLTNHSLVGFPGAIGFREGPGFSTLCVWPGAPRDDPQNIDESEIEPLLELRVGTRPKTGVLFLTVSFPVPSLDLTGRAADLLVHVLEMAHALVKQAEAARDSPGEPAEGRDG